MTGKDSEVCPFSTTDWHRLLYTIYSEVICDPLDEVFVQSNCFKLVYEMSVRHRVKGLSEIEKHCCNFITFLHLS